MKRVPVKRLFRRLEALVLAAGVLWAVAVTAGSGTMAVTFSPPSSCSRLTIAVPRAVRPASGIS